MYYEPESRSLVIVNDSPQVILRFDTGTAYFATVFKPIDTKSGGGTEDPLEYVNRYIQSRTQEQQLELISFFQAVHNAFYVQFAADRESRLVELLTSLPKLNGFTPGEITTWLIHVLPTPPSLMNSYTQDAEQIYSREKTYIYSEYIQLAVIVFYCKLLLPVMGEYVRRINNVKTIPKGGELKIKLSAVVDCDNSISHSELRMYELMDGMLAQLDGMPRLRDFVRVVVSGAIIDTTNLVLNKHITEEDIDDYVLSILLVRKLPAGGMFGTDTNHLASRLSTSIKSILTPTSRETFKVESDGIVKEGGDEVKGVYDDTHAFFPLSVGQIAMLQYCTEESYLFRYAPHIDITAFRELCANIDYDRCYISMFHISIISAVLANIVTPVIFTHCDTPTLCRLIAFTYLLIKHNHPDIARVLLAFPQVSDGVVVPQSVKLSRVNQLNLKLVEEAFPITKKGVSVAIKLIDDIKQQVQCVWKSAIYPYYEVNIPLNFLTYYAQFICNAPYILDPQQPAGFE